VQASRSCRAGRGAGLSSEQVVQASGDGKPAGMSGRQSRRGRLEGLAGHQILPASRVGSPSVLAGKQERKASRSCETAELAGRRFCRPEELAC
jgi:hypothetical protein